MDTVASDHMTSNFSMLHDVTSLHKPILAGLPNDSIKYVYRTGKIWINSDIELQHLLIVPDFQQILLSVGKLASYSKMLVTFTPHECIFQDLLNKAIIFKRPMRR